MLRSPISKAIGLIVVTSLAVIPGWPASALSSDDEQPASPLARSASSPILDALAFAPPDTYSFGFTDWTALKALHGGADITSASPLEERQKLVLDIVNSEASAFDFGLRRLTTWPDLWGWDNTDLAWEATWYPFDVRVVRFRDDWGAELFIDRLEALGYSRRDNRYGTLFSDPPDFTAGPDTEAILDADELLLTVAPHSVAISKEGRTVAIREGNHADEVLRLAARAEPASVAASPFGRTAAALGRPVTATIVDGIRGGCQWAGLANIDYTEDMNTLARSVGPLHPYQALGMGYERDGPGEPVVGHYVFAYEKAKQAKADLWGRRTLIDEGYSSRHGLRYRDAAFTLVDGSADGRELVFDVAPMYDNPKVFHDLLIGRSLSFATCGS